MKRWFWLGWLLTGPCWAEPNWIQFETFPPGAEVYFEGSGGPRFLGLSGTRLPVEPPQALDRQGKAVQALPGRVQFRRRGHQNLTVTVAAEEWSQQRLPRSGSYRLVPDSLAIQLLDLAQGYPLACLLFVGSLLGGLRLRQQMSHFRRRSQHLEGRQKPGDDPVLGTTVGGYHLLERLGQGGMATVYRARSGSHDYALKLLVADRNDPEKAARFRRECRLAAHLKHPTLVRVIEYGEQENLLYLVMELVEGEPLRLRSSGLDWEQVWPWYRQLLVGVNYAHSAGVVHRDLKPDNILVQRQGGLKVVDFGLARTQEGPAITETGKALGTPSYLAPEQLTGGGDLVEPRTDQYALGILLFQALTGTPPFCGLDAADVAAQHLSKVPPRLRELRPDLPVELEIVVSRMLAKNPMARFDNLSQVLQTLEKVKVGPQDSRAEVATGPCCEEETREL